MELYMVLQLFIWSVALHIGYILSMCAKIGKGMIQSYEQLL